MSFVSLNFPAISLSFTQPTIIHHDGPGPRPMKTPPLSNKPIAINLHQPLSPSEVLHLPNITPPSHAPPRPQKKEDANARRRNRRSHHIGAPFERRAQNPALARHPPRQDRVRTHRTGLRYAQIHETAHCREFQRRCLQSQSQVVTLRLVANGEFGNYAHLGIIAECLQDNTAHLSFTVGPDVLLPRQTVHSW